MSEFIDKIAADTGLPVGLVVIIMLLGLASGMYIFSLLLESMDKFFRPWKYRNGHRIRTKPRVEGDDLRVVVEGLPFLFPIHMLTERSHLSLEGDRGKLEGICTRIAEAFVGFEKDHRVYIDDEVWDEELYRKIDLQDPSHSEATIQLNVLGHHHGPRTNGHVISLRVDHMLSHDKRDVIGTVQHELLHHYVLYSVGKLRQLGEGVVEYLARMSARLQHHGCHGSYQSSVDIMGALVRKLRNGPETLVAFAMKRKGIEHEINSRLCSNDLAELERVLGKLPGAFSGLRKPSVQELVRHSIQGDIAITLNMLMTYAYAFEAKGHGVKSDQVVEVAKEYIELLEYRDDAPHTIIFTRGNGKGGLPVNGTSPKPPESSELAKPKKQGWFWSLPPKIRQRLIWAALGLIAMAFVAYIAFSWFFGPDKVKKAPFDNHPMVMNRSHLTPEQFEQRKVDMEKFRGETTLFAHEQVAGVPQRLKQYWPTIKAAAADRHVDPLDIAPLAFQESYFVPTAYNTDSKASGMYQFMESTAGLSGLNVKDGDFRLRFNGKDYRQDVVKSSYATAELYSQALGRWGGDKLMAYWDHHAGTKYPTQAMSTYLDETHANWRNDFGSLVKAMKALNVGYWDLRLRPTPTFAPATWKLMTELNTPEHDFSADYPMRVDTAKTFVKEILDGNVEHFNEVFADYKMTMDKFHLKGEQLGEEKVDAMWWVWYGSYAGSSEMVPDCASMAKVIKAGTWVKIPDDLRDTGFTVDKTMGVVTPPTLLGPDETSHNEQHTLNHQYALPEAVGAALWLTAWYKEIYSEEKIPYESIPITSLGRSKWFQGMLIKMNSSAATDQLPLHTLGLAFDAGMGSLSQVAKYRWYFVLNEAQSMGMISVSYEGKSHNTHIVPAPKWRKFFADYYHSRVR